MSNQKLSAAQARIVKLMGEGYELASSGMWSGSTRYWLQHGGAGKGGKTEKAGSATACALLKMEVIEVAEASWNRKTYRLAPTANSGAPKASREGA